MPQYFYTVAGLAVTSDLAMPGLIETPAGEPRPEHADIVIHRGVLPPPDPEPADPLSELSCSPSAPMAQI